MTYVVIKRFIVLFLEKKFNLFNATVRLRFKLKITLTIS